VSRPRKAKRRSSGRPPPDPGPLHYKVVELSTVDEGSLEHAVNLWVRQGWTLETVQFAMRESSKRPAMAFVFFTRMGEGEAVQAVGARSEAPRPDPWSRLAELAAEGDES
jgi:hypothetical protein